MSASTSTTSATYPDKLRLVCPCGVVSTSAPFMTAASLLCRRTCKGCGQRWRVRISVIHSTHLGIVHEVVWHPVN